MSDINIIDNTATGFQGQTYTQDMVIQRFKITNKTGGTVTLNVRLYNQNAQINISPLNVQLAPATSYEDEDIELLAGNQFNFTVNGSCDYYIDISQA